jgi:starch phosphorylase
MPSVRNFTVLPALPQSLQELDYVARNMFWAWNPQVVELFRRIDANLWVACGHNPVKLLGSVSQTRLQALARNESFLNELKQAADALRSYLSSSTWYDKVCPQTTQPVVAYFSAEFGLHECLPIYSGGLGILAGDHLKSASDLGVPLVGVGLMYQKGYFRQHLNIDGWQQEAYVENDAFNMPIELVRKESGRPLTISVEYPGRSVQAQIWCVSVGRIKLYLLDSNIAPNSSVDRMITSNLYGGDRELRIRQEILLGIGGLKALLAMGIEPTVCHMNEGHAAFMALERIRQLRNAKNMTFDEAVEATRSGNVFTVHTLVKAGLDEFSVELMDKYFEATSRTGCEPHTVPVPGRLLPDDETEPFKMPVLAIRLTLRQRRQQTARQILAKCGIAVAGIPRRKSRSSRSPTYPSQDVAVGRDRRPVPRYLGPSWSESVFDKSVWDQTDQIPDEELWSAHQRCKERLIVFAASG